MYKTTAAVFELHRKTGARLACSVERVLFDPRAHEPLADVAWEAAKAEAAIREIAQDADGALREGGWWPLHPLDDDGETPDAIHGVYFGAVGVLWALDHLVGAGLHEPGHDYARLATEALESYRHRPEFGAAEPGLFLGEGGIALVAFLLAPESALADRLAELVVVDPEGDTRELLWGSPGLLLVADEMLRRTGERRWADAWTAIAGYLLRERGERIASFWTQRLDGKSAEILGPAHGLAGIVAALARRPDLLASEQVAPDATAALAASVVREDGIANWPPTHGEPLHNGDGSIRTQWCHGAPGIVASAAALPPDPQLDALLVAGRRGADVGLWPAAQGRQHVPRDGRQRLRAAEALHPHGRRAVARPRPALRRARRRSGLRRPAAVRARPVQPVDRRPRNRRVSTTMHRRKVRHADARSLVTLSSAQGEYKQRLHGGASQGAAAHLQAGVATATELTPTRDEHPTVASAA